MVLPCLFLLAGAGVFSSCKQKENKEYYVKSLSEMAEKFNMGCPKDQANGSVLRSVTFKDNVLLFRSSVSEYSLSKLNIDNTKDSIINSVSGNLKNFLVKGDCTLEYRYISPEDSLTIVILPSDLQPENPDVKKQEDSKEKENAENKEESPAKSEAK